MPVRRPLNGNKPIVKEDEIYKDETRDNLPIPTSSTPCLRNLTS